MIPHVSFLDPVLLAVQELGTGEHGLRRLPLQADDAEQGPARVGRLRGREPRPPPKDVQPQMGVHLYAGGSPVQGGQEEGQTGEEDPGHTGESILGCVSTAARYVRRKKQRKDQNNIK